MSRRTEFEAVARAEAAVRGGDVLIVATTSTEEVFDPEWLAPVHATTLDPKFEGASEIDPSLPCTSVTIVTDSLAQVDGYDRPYVVSGAEGDRTL